MASLDYYTTEALALAGGSGEGNNNKSFSLLEKVWVRIEGNNPFTSVYIDWDDGEDNSVEKANSQWIHLPHPQFYVVTSHVFTKHNGNASFYPLVRFENRSGFVSRYFTHSTNTGYSPLDDSLVTFDDDVYGIRPQNVRPKAILEVDRKEVYSGILNDNLTAGHDVVAVCKDATGNTSNAIELTYVDNSDGYVKRTNIDLNTTKAVESLDVKMVLKAKLNYLDKTNLSLTNSYDKIEIIDYTTELVICVLTIGNPIQELDDHFSKVECSFSSSYAIGSNLDIVTSGGYNFDFDDASYTHTADTNNDVDILDGTQDSSRATVRYTFDWRVGDEATLTTPLDSYNRFYERNKLIRLQVSDDHSNPGTDYETYSTIEDWYDYSNSLAELHLYQGAAWETPANMLTKIRDGSLDMTLAATGVIWWLFLSDEPFDGLFFHVDEDDEGGKDVDILGLFYAADTDGDGAVDRWKPLKYKDTTLVTSGASTFTLGRSGTYTWEIPHNWVESQNAPAGTLLPFPAALAAWSVDKYAILMGLNITDAQEVLSIFKFNNSHSQLLTLKDPMAIDLGADVKIAQAVDFSRSGSYSNIKAPDGRLMITKLSPADGVVRFGGLAFGDYSTESAEGYDWLEAIRDYYRDDVRVFVDITQPNGDVVRLFGKISQVAEDIPVKRQSQKWAVEMLCDSYLEYNSSGWVTDGIELIGGKLINEKDYYHD